MFARTAAAEIAPAEQNLGVFGLRPIQNEIFPGIAVRIEPPVFEEMLSEPRALGRLQKPCRDDLIRIDIVAIQH